MELAQQGLQSTQNWLEAQHGDQKRALKISPSVAVLASSQAKFDFPTNVQVYAEASVKWHGSPKRLVLLRFEGEERLSTPSNQIQLLREEADADDCWLIWPVHDWKVCSAVQTFEVVKVVQSIASQKSCTQWWRRALVYVRIFTPPESSSIMSMYQDRYGPSVAFSFTWTDFYTQQLWVLAAFCVMLAYYEIEPSQGGYKTESWKLAKAVVVMWGAVVAIIGWRRFLVNFTSTLALQHQLQDTISRPLQTQSTRRVDYRQTSSYEETMRWLKLLLLAGPALAVFSYIVYLAQLGVIRLTLYLSYIWGDCINLPQPCYSAQVKHGFLGFLAEGSCDVLLVLLFEIFRAVGQLLAEWIATLRNYKYANDHKVFVGILRLALDSFEMIGWIACLAFAFVPQWEEPSTSGTVDLSRDCSDVGESSFSCLQRRLPVEVRRWVFQKLLKGQFVIMPFVRILVKVILPWVVWKLNWRRETSGRGILGVCKCISRILALGFVYDESSVGGSQFVAQGWPFTDIMTTYSADGRLGRDVTTRQSSIHRQKHVDEPDAPEILRYDADLEEVELLTSVLQQAAWKPFDPDAQLLDLRLSFLWVLFLAPVMPIGVVPTLIASILETKFDKFKMLYIRRHVLPEPDKILRRLQSVFIFTAAFANLGWTMGLSLLTYNDDLWRWGGSGNIVMILVIAWTVLSILFAFLYNEYHRICFAAPGSLQSRACQRFASLANRLSVAVLAALVLCMAVRSHISQYWSLPS